VSDPARFHQPVANEHRIQLAELRQNYYVDYNARFVGEQDGYRIQFPRRTVVSSGFITHSLSSGYYFRHERFDLSVNLGVSNLADNFYSEQFVFAPARGRSFTIGTKSIK
jgi:outer membrane receptor protein involved in Fe transport